MYFFEFFFVPIVIFLVVVAPIWIIAHYLTRWRSAKSLSSEEEKMLAELWEGADRMEGRIKNLESILDIDDGDWRKQG